MQNDSKDQSYPGYPHYPAGEDITQRDNNNGKMPLATEGTSTINATDHLNELGADVRFVAGTDADVTSEDLALLDAADQNMDRTDSNNLQQAKLDSTDDDGDALNEDDELDVPGSEDDDVNESLGEEDEENNYYSLGGDNHEAQEERKGD